MKKTTLAIVLFATITIIACKKTQDVTNNQPAKEVYLDLSDTIGNYYNGMYATEVDQRITLGRVLFYDGHLSLNNAISCASCHKQQFAFADNTAFSRGFEGRMTGRNSPAIQNLSQQNKFTPTHTANFFTGSLFWDGRENNLKDMVMRPVNNHVEMGIADLGTLPDKLNELEYYQDLVQAAYDTDELTVDMIAESLAWFLLSVESKDSRFDQFNMEETTLTAQELNGMSLFVSKYNCASCHIPFSPYHGETGGSNIGLDATTKDKGIGAVANGQPGTDGAFRIPNLHNVGVTGPYMHDGRFKTLDEVIDHYSKNIHPHPDLDQRLKDKDGKPMRMNIPDAEKDALIAFLNTMTDHTLLTKSTYSNPFKTR